MEATPKNGYRPPLEQQRLKVRFRSLLADGEPMKVAVSLCGISARTGIRWKQEMGKIAGPAKGWNRDKDSANAFIIHLKKKGSPAYMEVEREFQNWVKR